MNTVKWYSKKWFLALLLVAFVAGCGNNGEGDNGENPDSIAPAVSSTIPLDLAAGVALNSTVNATFSEAMDPATIDITAFTLMQGTTSVSGAVTYDGTTATFTPAGNLAAGAVYTATITTAVKDLAGNATASVFTWTFTTGTAPDITAPTVISTIPLDLATGVAVNSTVNAAFSEGMSAATITPATFTVKQGSTLVIGTVTYVGTTASFMPAGNLAYSTVYTATISTGVKDAAGNAMAAAFTWTFTTGTAPDTTAPLVSSTNPANGATGVAINSTVTATFSEVMSAVTFAPATFTVKQGSTPVSGAVTYTGTKATFTPASSLTPSTLYTATITTGVKDLAGNALAANKVWSFTTATATAAGPAQVLLGAAGNYVILAETGVSTVPASAITGDIGLSPAATSFLTGFSLTMVGTTSATSPQVTGNLYGADMSPPTSSNLTTAITDMGTAYTDAAGRPTPDVLNLGTGEIGGQTLIPGLYKWTTGVTVSADVILSGGPNDVWIFQIPGNLGMSAAKNVILNGGAKAKNIFWQVAGTVNIGTGAHFEGILLSQTSITLGTGASMNGRALAQTAVSLDQSTVVQPAQ